MDSIQHTLTIVNVKRKLCASLAPKYTHTHNTYISIDIGLGVILKNCKTYWMIHELAALKLKCICTVPVGVWVERGLLSSIVCLKRYVYMCCEALLHCFSDAIHVTLGKNNRINIA